MEPERLKAWRRSSECIGGWCAGVGRRDPRRSGSGRNGSESAIGPVNDLSMRFWNADRKAPRKQRHTAHRIYHTD